MFFIEINGHLVHLNAIVQVTPNGGVQLFGGSVVHTADEAEHERVRSILKGDVPNDGNWHADLEAMGLTGDAQSGEPEKK